MKQSSKRLDKKNLELAQIFFKFAFAIQPWSKIEFTYFEKFIWGGHTATKKELKLNKKQEQYSVALLHHVATYLLALQIDTTLEGLYKNRFLHKNLDIQSASWIARLIRNSFAHNPYYPTWLIDRNVRNKIYFVNKIIKLDTNNLSGTFVERSHFGGPIALLHLSNFVKKL